VAKPRLLFLTDRGERHQRAALKSAPPEIAVIMKRRPPKAELMDLMSTVEFLISERNQPVTKEMLEAALRLKLIVRLGSLAHDIDLQMARETGVRVSLQPVVSSIYAAEHAMLLILAVLRRFGRSMVTATRADHGMAARRTDENTFAFNWLEFADIDGLYDKSVAILGMGEIGVELARRLKPFRLKTLYYHKRQRYPKVVERELWLRHAEMLDCVKQGDVVVSLLPFTAETDRSIHAGTFALMKPTAVFVHLGSGSVVDEQALVEALKNQKIAGAALDTYEYEPLQPTHSLVKLARDPESNLILTPHVASASLPPDRSEDFVEIKRFLAGEPLKFEIT
jgi:lactate dehydrogenase-like 2-hydroxyacid dehydrogenase